jgi:hypothetical protein
MKLVYTIAVTLLLICVLQIRAETDAEIKLEQKQKDVTNFNSVSESKQDSDEDIATEDLVTIIEHLREIHALRDTIKSLLPLVDSYVSDKDVKQQEQKDKIESGIKNSNNEIVSSWMKTEVTEVTEVTEIKDVRNLETTQQNLLTEDKGAEEWKEDKSKDKLPEKIPELRTREEQEGI